MTSVRWVGAGLALLLVLAATAQQQTDQERAAILGAQGAELFAKTDYDGAQRAYTAALAIAISNDNQTEIARNWRKIGSCLYRKRDLKAALEMQSKALELSTRIGDKQNVAETLQGMTTAYIPLGRLDEAERTARQSIAAYNDLGDKHHATGMMVNLAVILGEKGDQEAKAAMLRQAIRECEEAGSSDDILYAAVNNLGIVYFDQGDYERSIQYVQRSAELLARQGKPDKSRLPAMHSNLGVMHQYLGHDKQAFDEYDKAIALAGEQGDTQEIMRTRVNRASLYRTTGKLDQAVAEMRVVAAHYDTSSYRTDAVRINGEFAQTLLAAGDARGAADVAEKALREARSIGGPDLVWLALLPLGDAYLSLGKREQARASYIEAISAVESIKLGGSEDEKDNFFHSKTVPYHGMVRLLSEDGNVFEALQYAERAKARLLLDVLRGGRAEITRSMTDVEKKRERKISGTLAKLDSQLAPQGDRAKPELLAQRTAAGLDFDNFHAALYQAHPELRVRRADFQPITTGQIDELLPDAETALIEYTVTSDAVYLFAIARDASGKSHIESHTLRAATGISAGIENFRAQLAARDLRYRVAAQTLYTQVLGPASVLLRGKKRLVIVPDGPLWDLPFQALVSPRGRHVIEESAVFYAPSLTAAREMLHLRHAQSDRRHTLLAMSGPISESTREVRRIGELYGSQAGAVFVGGQAEKERWKSEAPQYRILHLATHGILNSNNPLYSYLVMNRVAGEREDSLLVAREILAMNLQADITVLSACETARGKFRFGEGLIGMSWAFMVAGTPTTVVSQWKVDSASTSQLMVAFHRNLKARGDGPISGRAEALRGAVLQLLSTPEYRHPFYWAGFVMIGDGY